MYAGVYGVVERDTSIIFFVASSKKEQVGAAFIAEMTARKKVTTLFTDEPKADGALLELLDFFRSRALHASWRYRHNSIILMGFVDNHNYGH